MAVRALETDPRLAQDEIPVSVRAMQLQRWPNNEVRALVTLTPLPQTHPGSELEWFRCDDCAHIWSVQHGFISRTKE